MEGAKNVWVKVFFAEHACHILYLLGGKEESLLRRKHKRIPNVWRGKRSRGEKVVSAFRINGKLFNLSR